MSNFLFTITGLLKISQWFFLPYADCSWLSGRNLKFKLKMSSINEDLFADLRKNDYKQLRQNASDVSKPVYLDNAAASLPSNTLMESVYQDLIQNVYPSPHSDSETRENIDTIRNQILKELFNTDDEKYW